MSAKERDKGRDGECGGGERSLESEITEGLSALGTAVWKEKGLHVVTSQWRECYADEVPFPLQSECRSLRIQSLCFLSVKQSDAAVFTGPRSAGKGHVTQA